MQFLFNILFTFATLWLLSLSFFLIYKPTKTFHISHAFTIALAPYAVYALQSSVLNLLASNIVVAVLLSVLFGNLNEIVFYRAMRRCKNAGLMMLVLSLGVYIFCQNLLSVIFGDDIKSLVINGLESSYQFYGVFITKTQLATIAAAIMIFLFTFWLWHKTNFGRAIRAIAENPELSQIFGIPRKKIILLSFALGSAYAGIAGILIGFDTGITPTMGFSWLLYGIVVMIIGGTESLLGIALGAFILASVQNITSYYLDTRWMDAITYLVLIVFLIIRPYGVSGAKIRKAEI